MITPTIGRKVWYRPTFADRSLGKQPFDATIVFVHNERLVNLVVFAHRGEMIVKEKVHLLQPGDPKPFDEGGFAEWMPYQKGQAEKNAEDLAATKTAYEERFKKQADRMDDIAVRLEELERAKQIPFIPPVVQPGFLPAPTMPTVGDFPVPTVGDFPVPTVGDFPVPEPVFALGGGLVGAKAGPATAGTALDEVAPK